MPSLKMKVLPLFLWLYFLPCARSNSCSERCSQDWCTAPGGGTSGVTCWAGGTGERGVYGESNRGQCTCSCGIAVYTGATRYAGSNGQGGKRYEYICCGEGAVFTRETADSYAGWVSSESWVDVESFEQPASGTVAGDDCGSEYNQAWIFWVLGSLGGVLALFCLCVFAVAHSTEPDGAVKYLPRPLTSCIFRCLVRHCANECGECCRHGRFRRDGATTMSGFGRDTRTNDVTVHMHTISAMLDSVRPPVATATVVAATAAPATGSELGSELEKLVALYNAGALTEKEFAAAKAKLLQ